MGRDYEFVDILARELAGPEVLAEESEDLVHVRLHSALVLGQVAEPVVAMTFSRTVDPAVAEKGRHQHDVLVRQVHALPQFVVRTELLRLVVRFIWTENLTSKVL